jgi:hypothetical protein
VAAPQPVDRRLRVRVTRARRDVLAGLLFVAFGLAFAVLSTGYEVGSPVRMGPGYFPLVLGILLVGLGGLVAVRGVLFGDGDAIGIVPWRAIVLLLAAIITFGVTVRGLGLVPSTLIAVLLSALASRRATLISVLLVSVGLTALCMLVFVVALNLRLTLFGPWLPL